MGHKRAVRTIGTHRPFYLIYLILLKTAGA